MTQKDRVRYQDQPWFIKLYLNIRYETPVPVVAVKIWVKNYFKPFEDWNMTFKNCWSLAKGLADVEKNHLYTWEETKEWLNDNHKRAQSKNGRRPLPPRR